MSIRALSGSGLSPASPVGNAYVSSLTLSGGVVKNPYTGTGVTITIGTVNGNTSTITLTGTSPAWTSAMTVNSVLQATAGTGSLGTGTVTVTSVVSSTSVNISSTATISAGTITDLLIVSYGTGVFSAPASLTANTTLSNGLTVNGLGGLIVSSGNVGIGTNSPSATFHVVGTVAGAVASRTFIPAQGFNLPTSGFPAFYQRNTGSVKYELQYANDADQWSYTTIVIPSNWSGTTITFKLNWYTATTNQLVVWRIQAAVSGNGLNPNPSLSTVTTFNSSTNGSSLLKTESYIWTPTSGTVSAGNILYIGVGRLGTDASDTSQETVNFHSLVIEF